MPRKPYGLRGLEVTPRFELQWRVLRGVKSCDFVPLCGHSVAFHGMR